MLAPLFPLLFSQLCISQNTLLKRLSVVWNSLIKQRGVVEWPICTTPFHATIFKASHASDCSTSSFQEKCPRDATLKQPRYFRDIFVSGGVQRAILPPTYFPEWHRSEGNRAFSLFPPRIKVGRRNDRVPSHRKHIVAHHWGVRKLRINQSRWRWIETKQTWNSSCR